MLDVGCGIWDVGLKIADCACLTASAGRDVGCGMWDLGRLILELGTSSFVPDKSGQALPLRIDAETPETLKPFKLFKHLKPFNTQT